MRKCIRFNPKSIMEEVIKMNFVYYGFGLKINSNIQLIGLSEVNASFDIDMIEVFLNVIIDSDYSSGKSNYTLYYDDSVYILDFKKITYKIQNNKLYVVTKYKELFVSTFFYIPLSIILLLNGRVLLHSSAFTLVEKVNATLKNPNKSGFS